MKKVIVKTMSLRAKRSNLFTRLVFATIFVIGLSLPAFASYVPFNTNVPMNVGIGTSTPAGGLVVMSGNVGIGTWVPSGLLDLGSNGGIYFGNPFRYILHSGTTNSDSYTIRSTRNVSFVADGSSSAQIGNNSTYPTYFAMNGGNVGIGSTNPGQELDVQGTVRMTGLTMSGGVPSNGEVLTATDSSGDTTWSPAGSVGSNYWVLGSGGNVGINTTNNVGIGTSITNSAALSIMNGNVGIGTWVPDATLTVQSRNGTGNVQDWKNPTGATTVGIGTEGYLSINVPANYGADGDKIFDVIGKYGASGRETYITNTGELTTLSPLNATGGVQLGSGGQSNLEYNFLVINSGGTNNSGGALSATAAGQFELTGDSSNGPTSAMATLFAGNIGIGTISYSPYITTAPPSGGMIVQGNVGIGTWIPAGELQIGTGQILLPNGSATAPSLSFSNETNSGIYETGGYTAIAIPPGNSIYFGVTCNSCISTSISGGGIMSGNSSAGSPTFSWGGSSGVGMFSPDQASISFATSSAERLRIDTNGNVGIGSLSPGQKLDVQGTVRATGFVAGASGITLGGVNNTSWPSAGSNYWTLAGGTGNVGISTTNTVGIGTTSGVGAGLVVMNGNVGIGTWVPNGTLDLVTSGGGGVPVEYFINDGVTTSFTSAPLNSHIVGFVSDLGGPGAGGLTMEGISGSGHSQALLLNGYIGNSSPTAGTQAITINGAQGQGGGAGTLNNANPILEIQNNGTAEMDVMGSGNVGIGSTTPSQTLDVNGTVRATGFVAGASGITLGGVNNTSWPSAGSNYWTLQTSGNIGISTVQNVGIGTTFVGGPGEGALSVMNGNVGIGTWVPNQSLTVNGNMNILGSYLYGTGTRAYLQLSDSSGEFLGYDSSYVSPNSHSISFNVEGTNAMGLADTSVNPGINEINMTWNLGIGTSTPIGGLVIMPSSGTSGNVGIGTWIPDSGALIVANGAGNVGIGTIRPGTALDVNGAVRATAFIGNGAGLTGIAGGGWTLGAGNVGISTTNNVGIGTNLTTTAGLTVMNGNVGIGTWVPGALLQVGKLVNGSQGFAVNSNGNVGIGNSAPTVPISVDEGTGEVFRLYDTGTANTSYGLGISAGEMQVYAGTSGGLSFRRGGYNGTESEFIDGNGNVGIGTNLTVGGLSVMNGNMGIGTWVPASTLNVIGSISTANNTLDDGSGDMTVIGNFAGGGSNLSSFQWSSGAGPTYVSLGINGSTGEVSTSLNILDDGAGNTTIQGDLQVNAQTFLNGGNVGIGSLAPGQALDVNGTVRMTKLTMSGGVPSNGEVLTATDSSGDTTWSPAGSIGSNYWTLTGGTGNVGISTTNTVGIGTTSGVGAGLVVMNGNVGIGTWVPGSLFAVGNDGNELDITSTGNISANNGSFIIKNLNGNSNSNSTYEGGGAGNSYFELRSTSGTGVSEYIKFTGGQNGGTEWARFTHGGNLGIGSVGPVATLDVEGSVSSEVFGGNGIGGNLGIGTNLTTASALTVMNGDVGIGTWVPSTTFNVVGTLALTPTSALNITAGGGVTVTRTIMRVAGNGGPVTVTANPAISAGSDGQEVIILGTDSTNTLTLTNGNGLQLAGGVSFTFNKGSTMSLIYDAVNSEWVEVSRSAN